MLEPAATEQAPLGGAPGIKAGWPGWPERLLSASAVGSPGPRAPELAFRAFTLLHADSNADELATALQELKPFVRELRSAYRTDVVRIRYSFEHALAYLMAYAPAYVEMAEQVIRRVVEPSSLGNEVKVGLVGSGPAPEAVALTTLLTRLDAPPKRLEVHLFDRAHESWRPVRDALLEVGCRRRWPGDVAIHEHHVDLLEPAAFDEHRQVLGGLDLVLMQNCLNEGLARHPAIGENLREVVSALPSGGIICIADQSTYPFLEDALSTLLASMDSEVDTLARFGQAIEIRVAGASGAVERNLMTGESGLISRRNVSFSVMAARVREPSAASSPPMPEPRREPAPQVLRSAGPHPTRHVPHDQSLVGARRPTGSRAPASRNGSAGGPEFMVGQAASGVVIREEGGSGRRRGLLVNAAGSAVFIPIEWVLFEGVPSDLRSYRGQRISFHVADVTAARVLGNRKALLAKRRRQLLDRIEVGDRLVGRVQAIHRNRVSLESDAVSVEVPVREIAHGWVKNPGDLVSVGEEREIEVLEVDRRTDQVIGSLKRCEPDHVAAFAARHEAGQLVHAEIVGLDDSFAYALVSGLDARIHVSQIAHHFVRVPADELVIGDEVWAAYVRARMHPKDRVLELSISNAHAGSPIAEEFQDVWQAMQRERHAAQA